MFRQNRRQFLLTSAAAFATAITQDQVFAQNSRTPGALGKGTSSQNIIVVGAGLAGLVAAFELAQVGHTVTILEARDYVGGRVLTLRDGFSENHFVDAGASRIPHNHYLTLAYTDYFGLNLKSFYPNKGLFISTKKGERSFVGLKDLIRTRQGAEISKWKKIAEGADRLPKAFAKALAGKIRLKTIVNRIEQSSSGVRVICQSGEEYSADRIICTVPLTVLGKIEFQPKLSSQKQLAIAGGYNYRASTRMFVEFGERFWEKDGLNGWGIFDDRPEELWQPTWDSSGKTGVLHAYLKGENAIAMDALPQSQQLPQLISRWEKILPRVNDYQGKLTSYSWTKDPWSMSGWAYPTKEQEKNLFSEIGKTEGRVYFAGEHTSEIRGWMQGALISGLRVAGEIHRTL